MHYLKEPLNVVLAIVVPLIMIGLSEGLAYWLVFGKFPRYLFLSPSIKRMMRILSISLVVISLVLIFMSIAEKNIHAMCAWIVVLILSFYDVVKKRF